MEPTTAKTLDLQLVTPERLLLSEAVAQVVVPGEEGDFGVLPGHAPVLSTLRAGIITVYTSDANIRRFFVRGGFAEVTPTHCILLAETARPLEALKHADVQIEISEARKVLEHLVNTGASHDEINETQTKLHDLHVLLEHALTK